MDKRMSRHYSMDDAHTMRIRQEARRVALRKCVAPSPLRAEPDLSFFENKQGLADDMKFLASMPELCDITFLVGEAREPICAVKAVLAARSKVFEKQLFIDSEPESSPDRSLLSPEQITKDKKLMMFLKRSSEPLINIHSYNFNLTPLPPVQEHTTMMITEFEADVFRQIIEYIHTGCVTLQPRTLLGVLNAADHYALEELKRACTGFIENCITVDTVCALLSSAEKYIQYKCTKNIIQRVLEFVDEHGNEVMSLGSFTLLPLHVVKLVLSREDLKADEYVKFQAILMWCKKYVDLSETPLEVPDVMANFSESILFHKIPATVLMNEIHPLNVIPYSMIMNALAFQADESLDAEKLSPARSSKLDRSMSLNSGIGAMFGSTVTLSSTKSIDFPTSESRVN